MRKIAEDELPEPRACRIKLWDDGTFDAEIYHSVADDGVQLITYERTTSEILWKEYRGAQKKRTSLSGGDTIIKPAFDDCTVRLITTVDPPYGDN